MSSRSHRRPDLNLIGKPAIIVVGAGGMGFYLTLCLAPHFRIVVYDDDDIGGRGGERLLVPSSASATVKKVALLARYGIEPRARRFTSRSRLGRVWAVVDCTDASSTDRAAIFSRARIARARYIRASYDYDARSGVLRVSVTDGPGFQTEDAIAGYTDSPDRALAMHAASWAARVVWRYYLGIVTLPQFLEQDI